MKTYTNYAPGTRGITVNSDNGPYIHYLDPGQSVKLDPKDVIAASDLGEKPTQVSSEEADRVAALEAENAELKQQVEGQADQITKLTADLEKVTKPAK
ncbi:hypothetical protein [Sphingomonas xinjiangensis]|uniref:Small-conductance mechanosensitive channel n=1 Tax=Sphingomonas xinjiangensis TaxID=643568 RepID=A0A840YAL4_9SPHN|nr:hypothetical protein [Sphingomonas xinjiangensis]MBB5709335.1 small-conductance mechanosensitive channel [Sphingomonas xinjiangensis]